MRSTNRAV